METPQDDTPAVPEPDAPEESPEVAPPAPPPEPEPPMQKVVTVKCGNPDCGSQFEFPVEPNVDGFTFVCSSCGAQNQWMEKGD